MEDKKHYTRYIQLECDSFECRLMSGNEAEITTLEIHDRELTLEDLRACKCRFCDSLLMMTKHVVLERMQYARR